MLHNIALKFTKWKENLFKKDTWELHKLKIVKITTYVCKHRRVFHSFWETLSKKKKTKKCGICCNNFTVWKIETINVKRQKQPPIGILKMFVEVFHKLNGSCVNSLFCSFRIFSLILKNILNILKRFPFQISYFNFPILKWKSSIFLAYQNKNYYLSIRPCIYKKLYIRRVIKV